MATNTYVIEYAKTGRSGCKDKDCKKSGKNKIEAGEMRIGKNSPNPFSQEEGDTKLDWYHPACWFATQTRMRAGSKKVESTDDLEGFEKLKADDKATVKDLIAGKGVGAKKKAPGKKPKAGSDDDDDEEEEKPKKKKAAAKKKRAAASDDDGSDEEEQPKKKKAKAAPKKKKAASDDDDDDDGSDDDKPKKKAAAKKKSGGGGGGGGGGGEKKRYEMDEKFWEVSVDGDSMTVTFGKIGSKGQTQTKSFANKAAAEKEAAKLIKQKTGKGYELQD